MTQAAAAGSSVRHIALNRQGPEDVLVLPGKDGAAGDLLTGCEDGSLVHLSADGTQQKTVTNTGGRPLGLDLMPDRRIVVCDSVKGLLAVDPDSGDTEVLTDRFAGTKFTVTNNPSVAPDGRIFFSASTMRRTVDQAVRDIVENRPTGRLFCYHPESGVTEQLATGLLFANGVALSPDGTFVLVAETGRFCVQRIRLTGDQAYSQETFLAELPGMPDNMSVGSDGLLWIALVAGNDPQLAKLQALPRWLRSLIAPLAQSKSDRTQAPDTVHVQAYDWSGRLVHNIRRENCGYRFVTGVREQGGHLYLGSIREQSIGVMVL